MVTRSLPHFFFLLFAISTALAQSRPVVFVTGGSLLMVNSGGVATAVGGVGIAGGQASYGTRSAVMALSHELLKCPGVDVTLDPNARRDYGIAMNIEARGGFIWVIDISQLVVVNSAAQLMLSERGETGRISRRACNAILADWGKTHAVAVDPKTLQKYQRCLESPTSDAKCAEKYHIAQAAKNGGKQ